MGGTGLQGIKNAMEDFVIQNMERVLKMYPDCCQCEKCRQDILVLALNHLPPRYVSSDKGDIFTRLESTETEDDVQIVKEIAKAVEIVSRNPRHDK